MLALHPTAEQTTLQTSFGHRCCCCGRPWLHHVSERVRCTNRLNARRLPNDARQAWPRLRKCDFFSSNMQNYLSRHPVGRLQATQWEFIWVIFVAVQIKLLTTQVALAPSDYSAALLIARNSASFVERLLMWTCLRS